ncbi:snoRNP complex protein nop56 [Brettanomyces bruxellensis]|uniref:Nucleolar protein 56 n=1 Tax=Dekkera bruxellensis TaxID=5007 RepID=A0A7D9D149_DEKBR|nr:snoRNP complex protein nop56 [Brettanomyces bruxellensis]VUG19690.1 NOP56 [Brettanomyces bruxellensis]
MAGLDYILYEEPTGYGIFKVKLQQDDIGARQKDVENAEQDLAKFSKMVELVSFAPFKGAAQALENMDDITEGLVSDYLKSVIELNIPKGSKKSKISVGISDRNLGPSITATFPYIDCYWNEVVQDFIRAIRYHGVKMFKGLQDGDLEKAELGLAHAYSRAKVKFSVQKNDNHIIQAIATLDQLDKDVNTFAMRVKEWYGWHFPELAKLVPDNKKFCKVMLFVKDKASLTPESLHDLAALVDEDASVAQKIIDAARISMGQDVSESDMKNMSAFAEKTLHMIEYRESLSKYLTDKMHVVAPNLSELIGEVVGARLISHSGSLTNLSKQAASTVQILGAEKALFRALKTKGNTPKYGLIYQSSFIGRAAPKNKGRISRYLANKCSIASRIDNFADQPTNAFGKVLKEQVEQRLEFYETGKAPMKNADAVKEAMELGGADAVKPTAEEVEEEIGKSVSVEKDDEEKKEEKKEKKEKKDKKDKKHKHKDKKHKHKSKKRKPEDDEEHKSKKSKH